MVERINTLFINNGSNSIEAYKKTFKSCDITTVPLSDLDRVRLDGYQLMILGDGHLVNIHDNQSELELVKSTNIPIIGICYGFQVLCAAYGANLERLSHKRHGVIEIELQTKHPMFQGRSTMVVAENHQFAIKSVKDNQYLICHAISADGCEILEVRGKQQYGFQFHPEMGAVDADGAVVVDSLINYLFKT